jgi:hypothetical protein
MTGGTLMAVRSRTQVASDAVALRMFTMRSAMEKRSDGWNV